MSDLRERLLGLFGVGLSWGLAWAAVFIVVVLIVGVVDPDSIDPGEGPLGVSWIGIRVGFASGLIFALILSFAERGHAICEIPMLRVAFWAILGSAALPLLTPMNDSIAANTIPLGLLCAMTAMAIARRAERRGPGQGHPLGWFGRMFAEPMRALL